MAKDNVVQFPYGNIRNPIAKGEDEYIDLVARYCMTEVVRVLTEEGMMITLDNKLGHDLGVVLNMLTATISREYNKEHFLHEPLDEICNVIKEMKIHDNSGL